MLIDTRACLASTKLITTHALTDSSDRSISKGERNSGRNRHPLKGIICSAVLSLDITLCIYFIIVLPSLVSGGGVTPTPPPDGKQQVFPLLYIIIIHNYLTYLTLYSNV